MKQLAEPRATDYYHTIVIDCGPIGFVDSMGMATIEKVRHYWYINLEGITISELRLLFSFRRAPSPFLLSLPPSHSASFPPCLLLSLPPPLPASFSFALSFHPACLRPRQPPCSGPASCPHYSSLWCSESLWFLQAVLLSAAVSHCPCSSWLC